LAVSEIGNFKMDATNLPAFGGTVADVAAPPSEESKHIGAPNGMVRNVIRNDLVPSLSAWRIWVLLGTNDIRLKYRRSTLGPFWITATIAGTVFGLGVLYSAIFNMPINEYLPYVAVGFVVWSLITGMITDGCITFLEAEGYAKQLTIPLSVYVLRTLFRNLFTFGHNIIIVPVVWLIFWVPIGWSSLLVIPGLFLIALNGLWMILLLGTLCTRFRDLPQIVASFLQVIFFLTPVMFRSDQLPATGHKLMDLNPFAALLALVREPLIGRVPTAWEYQLVIGVLLFGWALALLVYGKFRKRITYWL
jgi:ABC-type polysaccharide/polyol phosphate export permease